MHRKIGWVVIMLMLAGCGGTVLSLPIDLPQVIIIQGMNEESIGANQACAESDCKSLNCPTVICPTCPAITTSQAQTATKTVIPSFTPTDTRTTIPTKTTTWTYTPTFTKTPTKTNTSTFTVTATRTPTDTKSPTATNIQTETNTLVPTRAFTSTPGPTNIFIPENYRFKPQPGAPVYMQNFVHPDSGCNWMGVAGQVFDKFQRPVGNLVIVVEGTLNNQPIDSIGVTSARQEYGPGGYEVIVGYSAVDSINNLTATIYDLEGNQLSASMSFNTYADCSKNLALINFVQN